MVEPDLTEVLLGPSVVINVSTASFRTVDRLEVDGRLARYDSTTGLWSDTLRLEQGLNSFVLRAFDSEGAVRTDTIRAVHAILSGGGSFNALPEPRGGHAATLLADGRVLVTGGAARASGAGRRDIFVLHPPFSALRLPNQMFASRIGHTASLLPDGRVLIIGGSRSGDVAVISDLVTDVEIFDPETTRSTLVPVIGEPIQRAYHTVALYQEGPDVVVDLYGGRGDVSFGATATLGTRRDVRTLVLRDDTLISRTSVLGGILLDPLAGHTQTSLTETIERQGERSLIVGSRFVGTEFETVAMVLDYTRSEDALDILDVGPVEIPRTQHAAVAVRRGAVLLIGGRQGSSSTLVGRSELYIHETRDFFRFPEGSLGRSVFGQTATKLPDGRILVVGGFGLDSEALSEVGVLMARI